VIRVFIADDHAIVREGLVHLIEDAPDMMPVGAAGTSHEVVQRARLEDWDVLVLDLSLPTAGGVEVLEQVRSLKPKLPAVIFTMHPEERYAVRLLKAGALGTFIRAAHPTRSRRFARWLPAAATSRVRWGSCCSMPRPVLASPIRA
jgi:DNA-binding NarL/FixJ family response regulator